MKYHPNIEGRFSFSNRTLGEGRAYVHSAGFNVFNRDLVDAALHLNEVIENQQLTNQIKISPFYTVGIMWGSKQEEKMIDFYCFVGEKGRGFNPEIYSFVFREELLVPEESIKNIGCEDGGIIFGLEATHRRSVPWEIFIDQPPKIPGLRKSSDFADTSKRKGFAMKLEEIF
jgi:hypothetical protein